MDRKLLVRAGLGVVLFLFLFILVLFTFCEYQETDPVYDATETQRDVITDPIRPHLIPESPESDGSQETE